MKSLIISAGQYLPQLEKEISHKDFELKETTRKIAKHVAKKNLPAVKGDSLEHYVGEIKTGYEKIAADVSQRLQPAAHFPEASIDQEHFKHKEGEINAEITRNQNENHNAEYELGNFNPSSLSSRIRWAIIATVIILFGETLFNTKAIQVTGESMLFGFIVCVCVSFAVSIFAHYVAFKYKAEPNPIKRRIFIILSLLLVSGVFATFGIWRSQYLASHDIKISPLYFVIINLFFFIVAVLISFSLLPTWPEIKQNAERLKIYREILKRNREIKQLQRARLNLKEEHATNTKSRVRTVHYANYSLDTIRKMYYEAVAIFKATNIICRTDGKIPDCFSEKLEEPNIEDVTFSIPSKLNLK